MAMTLNAAVNILRRRVDFYSFRDRRTEHEAWTVTQPMESSVIAAIAVVLRHLSADKPIADCARCCHYVGFSCEARQVGQCKKFSRKEV